MNNKFIIEDNILTIDNIKDSFEVSSSPKNYMVDWDNSDNPVKTINGVLQENANNILLIDRNVYDLYFDTANIPEGNVYKLDPTEESKTVKTCMDVIEFLENIGFTKAETLVVVGGGIVQDTGAFVGACYKRGIKWVLFPTTLLSMCDSCIGGKTGINHNKAKNQVALFSAPTRVVINPNFLKTLKEREIKSGLGEILKLVITGGNILFDIYKQNVMNGSAISFESYKSLILAGLYSKKAVVEKDEFEFNIRKAMNYGHTLGHAIEVLSNYRIPHGQAVVAGMVIVDKISSDLGFLPEDQRLEIKKYALELLDNEVIRNIDARNLGNLLKKDKKTLGNTLTLVLMKEIGNTFFYKQELDSTILEKFEKIIREEFVL